MANNFTIDDIVNIAVGCGVVADRPAARERYKDVIRQQSADVKATAGGTGRKGFGAASPKRRAAAATGTRSATAPPTEYPSAWAKAKGRSLGVAAGLRAGRKAQAGTAQPGARITQGL